MRAICLLTLTACTEYGLDKLAEEPSDPYDTGRADVALPEGPVPEIAVDPAEHDFGSLELGETAELPVTIANVGEVRLKIDDLDYASGAELAFDPDEAVNGALPWALAPGEARTVWVRYVPVDEVPDAGELGVASNDPVTPVARASQEGRAVPFPGFSTGWYVVDDATVYPTVSNPSYVVDRVGDPDGYWYEPSGVHGLLGSADPIGDFEVLHDWILERAGAPTPVTGPLTFRAGSAVPPLEGASFSYVMCDFWLDWGDDPSLYTIASGMVDDGVRVMVNGEVLGHLEYGQSGSWPLTGAIPGQVNTLIVILQDNAEIEKFLVDLAFYRDGVMVTG
ncbi:MAG: hypothetical protein ACOZNI_02355 [Myxococcota bacterium]